MANAFPGCVASQGGMTTILEPSGTYAIACDIHVEYGIGSGVTGHIEGSLPPGPIPTGGS